MLNFIFISLADNDWNDLADLSLQVFAIHGGVPPETFKKYLVNALIGNELMHNRIDFDIPTMKALRSYFDSRLKIEYTSKKPDVDHDGGSAVIDLNLETAWRI